ncbi:MAG: STAS domain-containing protein [Chitinivibrionales bacterium]|nr:STAS domain-containing protein [Chitinivibrionales bacterium]MBD3395369.1 STAS domain-containing protein [Chitinivibrionales bacterium]
MQRTLAHASYDVFKLDDDVTVTKVTTIGREVREFVRSHPAKDLVLDLSGTKFLDSSGLKLLINIDKNLKAANRKCHILKPSAAAAGILEDTKLTRIFSVIHDCSDIAPGAVSGAYEAYASHISIENGVGRVSCSCPVCSSPHVIGFLIDPSGIAWRWEDESVIPAGVWEDGGEHLDVISTRPVVCMDCYACSTDIRHFNATADGEVVIPAALEPGTIAALAKGNKKRKQIMEIGKAIGDVFFEHPRGPEAACQAYLLAAECARSIHAQNGTPCPWALGSCYYWAYVYASSSRKQELLDNARAWLTRALQDRQHYDHLVMSEACFMLMVVSFEAGKDKEAEAAYGELREMNGAVPGESPTSIDDSLFWLYGADRYVSARSKTAD